MNDYATTCKVFEKLPNPFIEINYKFTRRRFSERRESQNLVSEYRNYKIFKLLEKSDNVYVQLPLAINIFLYLRLYCFCGRLLNNERKIQAGRMPMNSVLTQCILTYLKCLAKRAYKILLILFHSFYTEPFTTPQTTCMTSKKRKK